MVSSINYLEFDSLAVASQLVDEVLTVGDWRIRVVSGMENEQGHLVSTDLANRVLVFDVRSSDQAARLAAERKARGRPVDMRDTFIAGIALAHRAALATRNVAHFQDLPIQVIDPWRAADDPISRPSGSR